MLNELKARANPTCRVCGGKGRVNWSSSVGAGSYVCDCAIPVEFKRTSHGDEWAEYDVVVNGVVHHLFWTGCGNSGYYRGGRYLGQTRSDVLDTLGYKQ